MMPRDASPSDSEGNFFIPVGRRRDIKILPSPQSYNRLCFRNVSGNVARIFVGVYIYIYICVYKYIYKYLAQLWSVESSKNIFHLKTGEEIFGCNYGMSSKIVIEKNCSFKNWVEYLWMQLWGVESSKNNFHLKTGRSMSQPQKWQASQWRYRGKSSKTGEDICGCRYGVLSHRKTSKFKNLHR